MILIHSLGEISTGLYCRSVALLRCGFHPRVGLYRFITGNWAATPAALSFSSERMRPAGSTPGGDLFGGLFGFPHFGVPKERGRAETLCRLLGG